MTSPSAPPSEWTRALARMLVRDLHAFGAELERCPDEATLWEIRPGVTNSVGALTRHVCGNLQFFIGAVLGHTGYVRNREHEFSATPDSRDYLVHELASTVAVIERVMPFLTAETLTADFPQPVNGNIIATQTFLLHLSVHLGYHLGQANYLRRVITGDNDPGASNSLAAIARD